MVAQLKYSVFWARLVRQVPYWLGNVATVIMAAQATGLWLIAPGSHAGQVAGFVACMLNTYGIHGVAVWNPPRKSLQEMTPAEREELFTKFPSVRARWELMQNAGPIVLNPNQTPLTTEQVEAIRKVLTPEQFKALLPAYA